MAKQIATLGGGCFWCTEAVFQEIRGVDDIVSGYTGGKVPGYPTYREICSGLTGHAEVIQFTYDDSIISYKDILTIFMATHDPTTLNRQGADVGTQYRSVIYYQNENEASVAKQVISAMQQYFDATIVTEVSPVETFYPAEKEHQNYYRDNQEQGYCSFVISPKLTKVRKLFADKLK